MPLVALAALLTAVASIRAIITIETNMTIISNASTDCAAILSQSYKTKILLQLRPLLRTLHSINTITSVSQGQYTRISSSEYCHISLEIFMVKLAY